jgi:hypothetical protein
MEISHGGGGRAAFGRPKRLRVQRFAQKSMNVVTYTWPGAKPFPEKKTAERRRVVDMVV